MSENRVKIGIRAIARVVGLGLALAPWWMGIGLAQAQVVIPESYPGREAEVELEARAYETCLSAIQEADEAQACTTWIVVGTCAMKYASRVEEVEKFLFTDRMSLYRREALKRFPAYCNPMAQIRLALEVLDKDTDFEPSYRMGLWRSIIGRFLELTPEQRLIVAREIVVSPEAEALSNDKAGKAFLLTARADAQSFFPEVNPDGVKVLSELEHLLPMEFDSMSRAVLVIDALAKHQYATAREHLLAMDVSRLSPEVVSEMVLRVAPFSMAVLGKRQLDEAYCYRECDADPIEARRAAMLEAFFDARTPSSVGLLRHEAFWRFSHCDNSSVFERFSELWMKFHSSPEVREFADELVSYMVRMGNGATFESGIQTLSEKISGTPRHAFVQKYGARLAQRALVLAEVTDTVRGLGKRTILESALKLSLPSDKHALYLALGRLYFADGDGARARQYWAQIYESQGGERASSSLASQAYYLSILSHRRDKDEASAASLLERFRESYPASALLDRL